MTQSIMILTFFVSAPALTTAMTAKINDNEQSAQTARRLNDFRLLPSNRAALIAFLHSSRARIALAEEQRIEAWHARQRTLTSLSILRQPSPHATTNRCTFHGASSTSTWTDPGKRA